MASAETDVFHAIADPNRRKILHLLNERERPVQELVGSFEITFGAVSQHLKILLQAGLVARRREGRKRIYRLNAEPLKQVYDWTAVYERGWRGRFKKLRAHLEEDS